MQTAPSNHIVACPVTRWELKHVDGFGVLMVIRYIEKSEQLHNDERTTLSALLDPEQALQMAEALKKYVQVLQLGKTLKRALKKTPIKSAMLLGAPEQDSPSMTAGVSA
jgi:hypothetical protein